LSGNHTLLQIDTPPLNVPREMGDFFYAKVTHQSVHFTLFTTALKRCLIDS
jgi:hypothetical protein